jgi:uncharacterized membrane protein YedE/YeeE
MRAFWSSAAAGAVFAVGLAVSGMTLPSKVIGFLDVFGDWDPSLAFVMGGALLVYGIGFRLIMGRPKPVFEASFHLPTRRDVDGRLLGGAALFGIGWGLGGFCPGPALTSIGAGFAGLWGILLFIAAMVAGMTLHDRVLSR